MSDSLVRKDTLSLARDQLQSERPSSGSSSVTCSLKL